MTEEVALQRKEDVLTGTNMRMLAKGYWDKYFEWRLFPGSYKWYIGTIVALALALILLGLTATAYGYTEPVPAIFGTFILIFVAVAGIFVFLNLYQYRAAKEDFVDNWVTRWEKGDHSELPSINSVIDFTHEYTRRK
jgi:phosphoglycerol transferase MdoB-like AlkP superfamily enzyme